MSIVKLDDICEFINGGAWSDKEYVVAGLPVLKVSNCKSKGFQLEDINFLPYSSKEKYEKNKLHLGDVIIATVGSHPNLVESAAGRSCVVNSFVDGYYLNQNAVCLRTKDSDVLNQAFLGYLCKERNFQHYIQNKGRGAANQMRIAIGGIKDYEFALPDIAIQTKVADILSAYDNLIENNQKQIKLLEEAAQRLYKEWFVDLHFPGYEDTEIVDGVPEGWRNLVICEFIDKEIGGGWGDETLNQKCTQPAFVIRGTDLYGITHGNYNNLPFRYHAESNLKSRKLADGDIIFEVSGGSKTEGVAKTCLVTKKLLEQFSSPVMCASFCKMIRPKESLSQYLFNSFQYMRKSGTTTEYDKKSASSIVNYRWKDFLIQESLMLPDDDILKIYNDIAHNIFLNIQTKSISIEKAQQARDRLLPKLMSGELEV